MLNLCRKCQFPEELVENMNTMYNKCKNKNLKNLFKSIFKGIDIISPKNKESIQCAIDIYNELLTLCQDGSTSSQVSI